MNAVMKMFIYVAVILLMQALTKAYVFERWWFLCGTFATSAYMLIDTMIIKYEIRQMKKRIRKPTDEEIENLLKQVKEDFEKEWQNKHDGDR